jgi:hypothetical protein
LATTRGPPLSPAHESLPLVPPAHIWLLSSLTLGFLAYSCAHFSFSITGSDTFSLTSLDGASGLKIWLLKKFYGVVLLEITILSAAPASNYLLRAAETGSGENIGQGQAHRLDIIWNKIIFILIGFSDLAALF